MKFTVDRDALAEAVTWVARALPARPVVQVLTGLLLSAGQETGNDERNGFGWLTLSCFDYEVSARIRVRAEVAEPGTALVPGRLLVEIVRSLPGYPVEFADDPDGVSVTCGEAAFTVNPLPSAEYPDLPDLPQLAGTADGGVLAAAIGQVTPAASKDDTLPMLTAVNLELAGETITLAATDRYRLAVRDLPWHPMPRPGEPGEEQPGTAFLVPARTLVEAARMMTPEAQVRIMLRTSGDAAQPGTAADPAGTGTTDAMIGFEAGERRLTTRLLAGEFIRYRSRFPEEFGCTADLPADSFAEAVRRVSLVAERGTPVQLSFTPGRVTIVAATQGQARARESVPADFTGAEPSIAFSPQYLLDGLTAAMAGPSAQAGQDAADGREEGGDPAARPSRVRIQFTSPTKPAVITARPGRDAAPAFRYLVVPQRTAVLPALASARPGAARAPSSLSRWRSLAPRSARAAARFGSRSGLPAERPHRIRRAHRPRVVDAVPGEQ